MGDEWGGINFTFFYQTKDFGTIAPVYTSGLEGKVFAIHIG